MKDNDADIGIPKDFEPDIYLALNRDVAYANVDPAEHYINHGRAENRPYRAAVLNEAAINKNSISKDLYHRLSGIESFEAFKASQQFALKHANYFSIYDHLFSRFKGQSITFVEVGVLEGGSLFMWRNFFGPEARIIGIDINPDCQKWESHGFEIFIGDQADPEFWAEFRAQVGAVDLLLDDGGHSYRQQITTVECISEVVRDGGMIVVEDCHTSYMENFGDKPTFVDYIKDQIDRLNGRFGAPEPAEERDQFWSIEVFESVIAIKVQRSLAAMRSIPTLNMLPVNDSSLS